MAPKIEVFYRLGTAGDKELFESLKQHYYGVIVDSHTAAFYKLFVPSFLRKIKKPFFLDPQTYRFARDIQNIKREGDLRKSFLKLIEWYGPPIAQVLTQRQLIPKDFDGEFTQAFARRTIAFQSELMKARTPSQQSIWKYAKILSDDETQKVAEKPLFLVAPYFHFSSRQDPWYQISHKVASASLKFSGSERAFAVLSFPKEMLLVNKSEFDKIAEDYKAFDGFLIWASDMTEDKTGEEFLHGLLSLLESLSALKKPIYMLYGGFVSAILTKMMDQVRGFGRGICYGEGKDVDALMPVGGGAPARYYFQLTKTKLSQALARAVFTEHPELLCKCEICKTLIRQIERAQPKSNTVQRVSGFFDILSFTAAKQHFIVAHSSEIKLLEKMTTRDVQQDLSAKANLCEKLELARVFGVLTTHLNRWRSLLEPAGETRHNF